MKEVQQKFSHCNPERGVAVIREGSVHLQLGDQMGWHLAKNLPTWEVQLPMVKEETSET